MPRPEGSATPPAARGGDHRDDLLGELAAAHAADRAAVAELAGVPGETVPSRERAAATTSTAFWAEASCASETKKVRRRDTGFSQGDVDARGVSMDRDAQWKAEGLSRPPVRTSADHAGVEKTIVRACLVQPRGTPLSNAARMLKPADLARPRPSRQSRRSGLEARERASRKRLGSSRPRPPRADGARKNTRRAGCEVERNAASSEPEREAELEDPLIHLQLDRLLARDLEGVRARDGVREGPHDREVDRLTSPRHFALKPERQVLLDDAGGEDVEEDLDSGIGCSRTRSPRAGSAGLAGPTGGRTCTTVTSFQPKPAPPSSPRRDRHQVREQRVPDRLSSLK